MTNLKPCPFCGAEVEVLSDMHRTWGLVHHRDGCLFPNFRHHEIPEYDFEAWNRRHVETCRVESSHINEYGYATQANDYTFELSCGHCVTWDDLPDYCPWCGRKVEG